MQNKTTPHPPYNLFAGPTTLLIPGGGALPALRAPAAIAEMRELPIPSHPIGCPQLIANSSDSPLRRNLGWPDWVAILEALPTLVIKREPFGSPYWGKSGGLGAEGGTEPPLMQSIMKYVSIGDKLCV